MHSYKKTTVVTFPFRLPTTTITLLPYQLPTASTALLQLKYSNILPSYTQPILFIPPPSYYRLHNPVFRSFHQTNPMPNQKRRSFISQYFPHPNTLPKPSDRTTNLSMA